jgi:hypothetical protein
MIPSHQSEPLQRRANGSAGQEMQRVVNLYAKGVWGQCNAPSGGLGASGPQGQKMDHAKF